MMEKEKTSPNMPQVSVLVPKFFLKHFDKDIEGFFPCRSEAIRRGMNLVLEEIKQFKSEEQRNSLEQFNEGGGEVQP